MNRRNVLKLLSKGSLFSVPLFPAIAGAFTEQSGLFRVKKFVLIYDSELGSSESFLAEVGHFIAQQNSNWTERLEVLDTSRDQIKIRDLINTYGANTENLQLPIIVAIPDSSSAENEVELWTTDWLNHQQKALTDACYPLTDPRGWWSVEGDFNPTVAKCRQHLTFSPNHDDGPIRFNAEWINLLALGELQSLHSDHHWEMRNQGTVKWRYVNQECSVVNP